MSSSDKETDSSVKKQKGPTNGAGGPQHFYGAGYPAHFHHVPPHHMQHSPPPPIYQKDERTQRQYSKLKQKLERKNNNRNNGVVTDVTSGTSTPTLSPRKELNGRGGTTSGAWSEGEGSSAGASVHSDEDDTQAILELMSTARKPQVSDMTPTSALVQWNSQLPEGVPPPNLELTYDLILGDRGRYKAIYSGPSLSCRVRDLRPGCEYSVYLQIRPGAVTGATTEAVTFRAPAAPPDRVPAPKVTQRSRNSLLLRWPSAADNGARLQYYVLEMDDGDGFKEISRPRTRQHSATGLRPQTRYIFRIAAVNECGRGEWSEEVTVWTYGSPPPAPAPPVLDSAASESLALSWERRGEEEFTLQMDDIARGHGFLPVYNGPDRTHVCKGLRRASDYRFRLCCETTDGQGPYSTDVTYRTLPERPGAPGRPSAKGKIHSRAFRLRWEPPSDDGGAPVEQYTLELDAGDGFQSAYSGPDREAHCDRLQPGTDYRARVRCLNSAGESDWSSTETVTTDATIPAACDAPEPTSEPRATTLPLRWKPPSCTGGTPLTEYRVEVANAQGIARLAHAGLETECIVRELSPGRPYRVWVTACNRVGSGPPSSVLEFETAAAPPDAPDAPITNVQSPNAVQLEWTAPPDNGANIIDYRVEMSAANVDDAYTEIYRGSETNCSIDRLTPFTPYFFRVCATNVAGRGAWSAVRDVLTPRAPPAAPSALRYEATADSLRLQWRAPACHGADILHYRVEVGDAAFDTEGPTPERLVEGLEPDVSYRVRVAALNELGLGDWSEESRARTRPPPPVPPILRCSPPAHNHLRLEWDATGTEGVHYCVEMRSPDGREFRPVYRGSARSCKVKKLRESCAYAFRIRAADERGGRGPWSEPVTFETGSAPPPAPRAPVLQLLAPRLALVQWDVIDDAEYVLQSARGKDALFKQVYAGCDTQFRLEELEAGGEYVVRVCAVRGGLAGAWSAPARLLVPVPAAAPRVRRPRPARPLPARHAALLMATGFLVLAVLVAVLLQRLVEPRA
ncbi:fibronectin type-III domain-containing protein 3a isoform X2 [Bombyx mandarina]|uniref:Fibronectin type-III domain-containing protein 3a isoform X2 n=1 Tax=Bombyx mandarina TaxID=7092 RepID=A0A6J2JYS7_BOMMA|nr:fibronectin type-III domain-containing protein 3a isoform X2 [Bombyx mandarina]